MCGIVGYIGEEQAIPFLLEGLERLEYRGYDSAGVAVNNLEEIEVRKKAGKLKDLENQIEPHPPVGTRGIGHTRWATHGKPSDANSHPHYNGDHKFVLVHNGIIENFQNLKANLQKKGYKFN